jgi:hypothetical protein
MGGLWKRGGPCQQNENIRLNMCNGLVAIGRPAAPSAFGVNRDGGGDVYTHNTICLIPAREFNSWRKDPVQGLSTLSPPLHFHVLTSRTATIIQ